MTREIRGSLEGSKLTADIRVYCDPAFKQLAGQKAAEMGLPLSEFMVKVVAEHLGRPDLGKIPRKVLGRPLNKEVAAAPA